MDPTDDTTEQTDKPEQVPTVSCTACDREWELAYELDELRVGNRAVEQFALDHHRHTGHYPDDVAPWLVSCNQCPATEQYLEERPARRFARTHARHTNHTVSVTEPGADDAQQHTTDVVQSADDDDDH